MEENEINHPDKDKTPPDMQNNFIDELSGYEFLNSLFFENAQKVKTLLSSFGRLVFIFDKESRFICYYSPDPKRLFLPPNKFMNKKCSEVMPSPISDLFLETFEKNKLGEKGKFEYTLNFGLETSYFSTTLSPLFSQDEFIGSVAVIENITEVKKEEKVQRKISELIIKLVDVEATESIASPLLETVNALFNWDAFFLAERILGKDLFRNIYQIDTIDGKKVVLPPDPEDYEGYEGFTKILEGKNLLILRENKNEHPMIPFGDESRQSASLMFVPISYNNNVYGVLSLQSYQKYAYTDSDLLLLKTLADVVAHALKRTQVEKINRDEHQRYKVLFNAVKDAIFVHEMKSDSSEEKFIEVNDVACERLGYSREELLNLTPSDIDEHTEDYKNELHIKNLFENKYLIVERNHITKSGSKIPVEISVHLFRYKKKNLVLSVARDVTERKIAEQNLKNIHQIYRNVIENAEGVPYSWKYGDTSYDFIGEGIEKLLGIPKNELTFAKFKSLLVDLVVIEKDVPIDAIEYGKAFRRGEYKRYRADYKIRTPQGEEKWISDISLPVYDENTQKVIGSIGILQDITIRKNIENEREVLRRLSQRLTEPLTMKDVGKIIAQECYNLFKYDAFSLSYYDNIRQISVGIYYEDTPFGASEPVEQKPFILPMETFTKSRAAEGISSLVNRTEDQIKSNLIPFGEKNRISKSLMFVPLLWANKSIGILSIQSYIPNRYNNRDLKLLESVAAQCGGALLRVKIEEEHKKFEAQIQQAQKLESLGVLAGGVAHDFNNLLMGILGYANIALLELSAVSPARESIIQIEKSAQRAAELTKQLLAYSGKGKIIVEVIDLNELLEEMINLMSITVSKMVSIKMNLKPNIPPIEVDVTQIRQIVMNLVINASESIGEKNGVITISTNTMECDRAYLSETILDYELSDGQYVYFEVSDNGCGMDKETISKIFDPFFSTKFTGRGLGLPAVLGIVKGHNGAIKVYSEVGKGTTIKVLFPCSEKKVVKKTLQQEKDTSVKDKGIILVVDDEETIRNLTKYRLESAGYKVELASDGLEAMKIFKEKAKEIDLVLLDMTMPNMNGEETFREMRRIRDNVKIILSSGYNEQDSSSKFAGKGLAGFIQKPYLLNDLLSKIKAILK